MRELRTVITSMLLSTAPDGSLCLEVMFEDAAIRVIGRADVTASWLANLIDVLTHGSLSFGGRVAIPCRVRTDAVGKVLAIGSSIGNRWVDVHEADLGGKRPPTRAEKALRYLNGYYAGFGRRPLDPVASSYTDDDVIADALLHGWVE